MLAQKAEQLLITAAFMICLQNYSELMLHLSHVTHGDLDWINYKEKKTWSEPQFISLNKVGYAKNEQKLYICQAAGRDQVFFTGLEMILCSLTCTGIVQKDCNVLGFRSKNPDNPNPHCLIFDWFLHMIYFCWHC